MKKGAVTTAEHAALSIALDHMLAIQKILTDRIGPSGRRTFVALALFPGSNIGDLARRIAVSDSIASRSISQLAQMGLVRVTIDPESRRRHVVQLTPDGELAAKKIASAVLAFNRDKLRSIV